MVGIDGHREEYILGQNIRKYRLKNGWSQKNLSDVVDIDRADIPSMKMVSRERWDLKH